MDPLYKIDSRGCRTCPYNLSHIVTALRFINHLMKCQEKSPIKFMVCPWNATHHLHPDKYSDHVTHCESREYLDHIGEVARPDSAYVRDMQAKRDFNMGVRKIEGGGSMPMFNQPIDTTHDYEVEQYYEHNGNGSGTGARLPPFETEDGDQVHYELATSGQLAGNKLQGSQQGSSGKYGLGCNYDADSDCINQLDDNQEGASDYNFEPPSDEIVEGRLSLEEYADLARRYKVEDDSHWTTFEQLRIDSKSGINQYTPDYVVGRGRGAILERGRVELGQPRGIQRPARGRASLQRLYDQHNTFPNEVPPHKTSFEDPYGNHGFSPLPCTRGRCGRGTHHALCEKAQSHHYRSN